MQFRSKVSIERLFRLYCIYPVFLFLSSVLAVLEQGSAMPGQHNTPMRVGRDEHELLRGEASSNGSSQAAVGLGGQQVSAVAASRHFSMLLTDQREVFTCGGTLSSSAHLAKIALLHSKSSSYKGHFSMLLTNGQKVFVCGGAMCPP